MKYEVQTYTLCDGWVNTWAIIDADGKESPHLFDTEAEAQAELDDFFNDIELEIKSGMRALEEGYDREEYRIMPVNGGVA